MKTIKILIAASEEMHEETLRFSELIANLNEVLEPRGIELKRIKWNPDVDGAIEEFKSKLKDCEICLTLYWQNLIGNSEQELNTAYEELKGGNNPRNLYVFFKEPSEYLRAELTDFKANFVTNYGHFYCKFENVDTMNLHFILQFEACRNSTDNLVDVSDGRVSVCGQAMVNLSNVSFAALNKEYQQLANRLKEADDVIVSLSIKHKKNNNNRTLLKQLKIAKEQRIKIKEEFDTYQKHLYSIALCLSKKSAEYYSDRIIQARTLFEKGDVIGADLILNIKDIKQEAEFELTQLDQNLSNLELKIEEFQLKAETVMANNSLDISVRFEQACMALDEAILIARKIKYDETKHATLLFSYGSLLQYFNRMKEAYPLYKEALEIQRKLVESNPEEYRHQLAETLNNLGSLSFNLQNFKDAENYYRESLEIRSELSAINREAYLTEEAVSLGNLGVLLLEENKLTDAEFYLLKGLDIRRRLDSLNPANKLELAQALNNLGVLRERQGRYNDAEKSYQESLLIFYKQAETISADKLAIFASVLENTGTTRLKIGRFQDAETTLLEAEKIHRMLSEYNSDVFLPKLAQTLYNLAAVQYKLGEKDESQKNCKEALDILRPLVKTNIEAYLPLWADALFNYGVLQDDLGKYEDAEKSLIEALEIFRQLSTKTYCQNNVADSLYNLAIVQKNLGHYHEAEQSYKEALSIYKQLAKEQPDVYLLDMAQTLRNYGNLLKKCEKYSESRKLYAKAMDVYLQLSKKLPDAYQTEIGNIIGNMQDAQEREGLTSQEKKFFRPMRWFQKLIKSICGLFSNR